MKASLKRIEATLHDLGNRTTSSGAEMNNPTKRSLSFRISVGVTEPTTEDNPPPKEQESPRETPQQNLLPHSTSVQTFPAQAAEGKTPILPKFKTPSFTSHRNGANPAFAMNLLQEIQAKVTTWQTELQHIIRQIQNIYLEGPIVNGWLESQTSHTTEESTQATSTLRHAEVGHLMDYVEEICASNAKVRCQSSLGGYRLCGLDASGQVWSRPCPPDQVASVSMAIARYQKLRQLLGRKQYLETRLTQLAESLVILHSHIEGQ